MTVIAANAGRHPISAQRRILGAPRSACYHMPAGPPAPPAPDPIGPDVPGASGASRGGCGARRLEAALARSGITASRRRICGISGENGLPGAHSGRGPGPRRPARRRRRARAAAGLACVRAGSRRCCVCPLVDPYDREAAGRSRGRREDAPPAKAAFPDVESPPTAIEMLRSGRGAEFRNAEVDAPLTAFGIERSVSGPGNPHDDAVAESTSYILKRELVAGGRFGSGEELRAALLDRADWYNDFRIHSTLGYMSPVEFGEAGLILS